MDQVRLIVVIRPDLTADICACGEAGYALSGHEFAAVAAPVAEALAPNDPQVAGRREAYARARESMRRMAQR